MLIGELDHRANAVSIALLLAKVALLAVTSESDHDAVRTIRPVGSACGADLGAPGTDPAVQPGHAARMGHHRLDPDG
jgi:hypothetical protein